MQTRSKYHNTAYIAPSEEEIKKEYTAQLEEHIVTLNTELFFIHEKCQMLLNTLETEQKTSQMLTKLVDRIRAEQRRMENKYKKKTTKKSKKIA